MKYVVITLPPLLLFLAVIVAGELWLDTAGGASLTLLADARHLETAREREALTVARALPAPVPASITGPSLEGVDSRVPRHLAVPLKAVAVDVSLCVSQRLARDLGPLDIDVRFTPVPSGGFARGVQVSTTWDDPTVAECVAEVFEETTFMPEPGERFEPSQFVFHFPDDAMSGLLGMTFSPFH